MTVTVGAFHHLAVTSSGAALGNQTAGAAFPLTLTAQDVGNNTVPTFTGNVTLTANNSLFSGGSTTTAAGPFAAGTITLPSVVLTRANSGVSLTATNTLPSGETGTSAAVVVAAGAATKLQLLLPGETAAPGTTAGRTGTPTTTNSAVLFTVIVGAVDANWNVVAAATPTIHFTSNDAQATLPPNAPLVAGTLTFTSAAALKTSTVTATATITASDVAATLTASASAGVLVMAGPLDHFLVQTAAGGAVGSQVAGTSFAIRITAQDINNNTLVSFNGAAGLTAANSAISSGTPTAAFTNGVLASQNVTLSLASSGVFITAAVGAQSGVSATFSVVAGAVASFAIKSTSDGPIGPQVANTPFDIKITALDANQNTVTSFNSGVTLTSTGALTGSPLTSSSFTNGVLSPQSVTISNVGTFTLTASDGVHPATSNSFAVTATLDLSFAIECPSISSALPSSVSGSPGAHSHVGPQVGVTPECHAASKRTDSVDGRQ
jgi:hypothetical protein